jgi:hypothetical protein
LCYILYLYSIQKYNRTTTTNCQHGIRTIAGEVAF